MQSDSIICENQEQRRGVFIGQVCPVPYDRRKFRKATRHAANSAALVAVNTLSL